MNLLFNLCTVTSVCNEIQQLITWCLHLTLFKYFVTFAWRSLKKYHTLSNGCYTCNIVVQKRFIQHKIPLYLKSHILINEQLRSLIREWYDMTTQHGCHVRFKQSWVCLNISRWKRLVCCIFVPFWSNFF